VSVEARGATRTQRSNETAKTEIVMPHLAGKTLSGSKLTKANQWHGLVSRHSIKPGLAADEGRRNAEM
jgi:hypothetical protein